MRSKLFIIPAVLIFQAALAQDSTSFQHSKSVVTIAPAVSSNAVTPTSTEFTSISIMDYKSVYEAATLEEEVQMATERFKLSKSQQEVWATAAVDRRETEKQTRAKLESKTEDYSKTDVYRGLRSAQNQFYQTITGYFDPTQKQALEKDSRILEEKRKMVAKLPPPIIAPTVTFVPVDSAAIYESMKTKQAKEKTKGKSKSKKKSKTIGT